MGTLVREWTRTDRHLQTAVWLAQTILTVVFASAGLAKYALPIGLLVARMGLKAATIHFISVAELLAAIGLDPHVTKLRPSITALAASGLILIMTLAAAYHFDRGEVWLIPLNITLAALAAFVAWRHWRSGPTLG
jgi:putative oxidoreductase